MKKLTITLLIILGLSAGKSFAQTTPPGSGTASDPYRIESVSHLQKLRDEVNAGDNKTGKFYRLVNNLDLSSISNWTPIGLENKPFNGTFRGGKRTIRNMTISGVGTDNLALFGFTGANALIEGLILADAKVSGRYCHGGIIAFNAGLITECAVVNAEITGAGNSGLLVAWNRNTGVITKCYAQGKITSTSEAVGGICGVNDGNSISESINNCYVNAVINGRHNVGGIVGYQNYMANAVNNCIAIGRIESSSSYATGGLNGNVHSTAQAIKNSACLMTAIPQGGRISCAAAKIQNCYANKDMTVGGSTRTSTNANSADGADATVSQLKTQSFWQNTVGISFNNMWTMASNNGYPTLQWAKDCGIVPPANAQTYQYNYDACGNRISRVLVLNQTAAQQSMAMKSAKYAADNWILNDSTGVEFAGFRTTFAEEEEAPQVAPLGKHELRIYPNPTKGQLKVELLGNKQPESVHLQIFDLQGRLVVERKGQETYYELDLSEQPTGTYFLVVVVDSEKLDWKIIKQ